MALNNEQIKYLYAFTKKKMVHWYDVQVEIVDHLATAIEELMEANPEMEFELALQKVYAGFGIFGFSPLVRAKEESMHRKYYKDRWQMIRQQFTWPLILRTLAILAVIMIMSDFFGNETVYYTSLIIS